MSDSKVNELSVLIKPSSGACNMACRYCFYHSLVESRRQPFKGVMTRDTAHCIIDRAFDEKPRIVNFSFQGGEPLLSGLDFFVDFTSYARSRAEQENIALNFSLQTNGVLIDEKFCEFFGRNNYLLGVSVDGGAAAHNANRIFPSGKGSFEAVLKAVKLLRRFGVEFNILCVITNSNALRASEIYDFFKAQDCNFLQFIPALDGYCDNRADYENILSCDAYGRFLKEVFDCWYRDFVAGNYVSVRHIDNLVGQLQGYPPEMCGQNGRCNMQNVVEADGSVYPCDFFCTDEFECGNIRDGSFSDFRKSVVAEPFLKRRGLPAACAGCSFRPLCGGGCKRYHDQTSRDRFCKAYREYYAYCIPLIELL